MEVIQITPLDGPTISLVEQGDHIRSLINGNQGLWEDVINHPFPRQMAKGTAPLNGFRHYKIQDAMYLEHYVHVRRQSITSPRSNVSTTDVEQFIAKMPSSLQYAKDVRNACEERLGVPRDVIAKEPISQQLKNAIDLYERVAHEGNWLDMHIVLLPCIMGYYTIASQLLADPATIRNTPYYTLWIQENSGAGHFERYKKFINERINELPDNEKKWTYWIDIFGKACQIEKAFFSIAYEDFKYDVINDGRYKIRSYGKDMACLVPGEGGSAVALQGVPEERATWQLTNTNDGYLIENMATGALLGASVADRFPPYYEVNSKGEGYVSWSLNPVSIPGMQSMYQLFVSSKLQFTLDVDVCQGGSNVFVANSYTGSSQMWVLESVA